VEVVLWYVVPLAVMAAVFYVKLRNKVRFKDELPRIAHSLGLRFSDTADELPQRLAMNPDLPAALSDPDRAQRIGALARKVSRWSMEGEYDGVRVKIAPYNEGHLNQSPTVYTRIEAFPQRTLGAGLSLSAVGNPAPGKPEIEIDGLDEAIIVRADDGAKTVELLNDPAVRQAVRRAFAFDRRVIVLDDLARLDRIGQPMELDYYREALQVLTAVVRALEDRARRLG
jgi:hypothetical protein